MRNMTILLVSFDLLCHVYEIILLVSFALPFHVYEIILLASFALLCYVYEIILLVKALLYCVMIIHITTLHTIHTMSCYRVRDDPEHTK